MIHPPRILDDRLRESVAQRRPGRAAKIDGGLNGRRSGDCRQEVEDLRSTCYTLGADYLQQRNEAIVTTMYDTGLRVGELVQLDVELLRNNNSELYLPTKLQKDYTNENSPPPVTLTLAEDSTRLLSAHLNNRWKDSAALFPSRSSDRISEQGVRNMLHKIAEEDGIRPYKIDETRGDANDVTPHALRHGVAYRIMNEEDGNTL